MAKISLDKVSKAFHAVVQFVLISIFAAVFVVIIASVGYCQYTKFPPNDHWFRKNFELNKSSFFELKDLVCDQKSLTDIRDDGTFNPEGSIDEDAVKKIVALMKMIGSSRVQVGENCSVLASVWSIGFGGDGIYKQYGYNQEGRLRLEVNSIDEIDKNRGKIEKVTFYKMNLNGGWSVLYDVWP